MSISPADRVNPLIDTANRRFFFFSSACRPFGLVNLSPDTVHCHVANLRKKLGFGDRVELTRFAIREGLAEA